jgi:two-component system chemotaxis response regulator CheY
MSGPGLSVIVKRVLVIDDASLVRMYYRDILLGAGYAVDEALNGLEGLEKLLTEPADLVIVDINMPMMDGMTFLRALRRQASPVATTPALITSTEAKGEDVELARAAGANFYLVKPVARETLLTYAALLCGSPA